MNNGTCFEEYASGVTIFRTPEGSTSNDGINSAKDKQQAFQ